jgi:hypothetical protein
MADDHITLPRATVYQVLEALSLCAAGRKLGAVDLNNLIDRIVDATGAQAEPDNETRAELAEQQVVQLAEERDHYRRLWQKAQQAEPVQFDLNKVMSLADNYASAQSEMDGEHSVNRQYYVQSRNEARAALAQAEPCDMGQLCLNCQPRGLNGECPDKQAKQTKALTDEQKQAIHNVTGASLALICLVENYINGIKEKK